MTTPRPHVTVQAAFESAARDFANDIRDEHVIQQILQVVTMNDMYKAIDELQMEQTEKGRLQRLSDIQPFLQSLIGYVSTIGVFLQVKPEISALIWGPIKLILELASHLRESFGAVLDMMEEIGLLLPNFEGIGLLAKDNAQIRDVLLLLFKDILDFYKVAIKFFSIKHWQFLFKSMWPRCRDKVKVVMCNIKHHTILLRDKVLLKHMQEEHQARIRALQHFEAVGKALRLQEFDSSSTSSRLRRRRPRDELERG